MAHKELRKIKKSAKAAILFIHGIIGTPDHFAAFLPLIPDHVSVVNLLLDGHGKGVRDFSAASMKQWEQQVQRAVAELSASHETICIVAHSMGTLLAMEQAVQCQKIAGLFLLAVPLRLSIKGKMVTNAAKVYFDRIKPDDRMALAAKACCGIAPCKNPLYYIGWVPRYFELFAKIRATKNLLSTLKTPCTAFQSTKDEMVSIRSVNCLKQNPHIAVTELKESGHFYYDDADLELLLCKFQEFISIYCPQNPHTHIEEETP